MNNLKEIAINEYREKFNGAELKIVDGYPMIAPFMFYELEDIDDMDEIDIEEEKEYFEKNKDSINYGVIYFRNLDDPTKAKAIIGTELNKNGKCHFEEDVECLSSCFFVLKGAKAGRN